MFKQILIAVVLFAALVVPAFACYDPPCNCPDVQVTCQCNCNEVILPGLWKVMIQKEIRCGVITVFGGGFTLDEGSGKPEFFLINKLKRANQVESCE